MDFKFKLNYKKKNLQAPIINTQNTKKFKEDDNKYIVFCNCFPYANNAEKQLLIRFNRAVTNINYNYLEINNNGIILTKNEYNNLHIDTIDISLVKVIILTHHNCNINTKHKTLMTMWNPINFMDINTIKNFNKYFGLISAYSSVIDNYILRYCKLNIYGNLSTSLSKYYFINENINIQKNPKLFYIGINWATIVNSPQQTMENYKNDKKFELLEILDNLNLINIYGPKNIYKNINRVFLYKNYKNYNGEINFDEFSVIQKIYESGICLCINSVSHNNSNVCSMRIFEAIAAGVPIIADRNPFYVKYFGNNLWYIDINNTQKCVQLIKNYINYFINNPDLVKRNIKNIRNIFIQNFCSELELKNIIYNLDNNICIKSEENNLDYIKNLRKSIEEKIIENEKLEDEKLEKLYNERRRKIEEKIIENEIFEDNILQNNINIKNNYIFKEHNIFIITKINSIQEIYYLKKIYYLLKKNKNYFFEWHIYINNELYEYIVNNYIYKEIINKLNNIFYINIYYNNIQNNNIQNNNIQNNNIQNNNIQNNNIQNNNIQNNNIQNNNIQNNNIQNNNIQNNNIQNILVNINNYFEIININFEDFIKNIIDNYK